MAEKSSITFESIMSDLKARRYYPIYYLMGEESYYIDKIADFIANNVLTDEERDFNQTIVFGSDVTAVQVADLARRYPMMSEHLVVIVKEAQNIKNMEALEIYLRQPMTSTILVLCHKNGVLDRRKKLSSMIEKVGVLFESKKIKDYQIPNFIENYLKKNGATIDNKYAQIIADSVGADLNRLVGELEKLLIAVGDKNTRITPDIIEKQIGVSKDFNIYELRSAVVNRDIFKANQIIKYLDENPKAASIYNIVPILFSYFSNLMLAYYSPDKTDRGLASWLGLGNAWAVKDYMIGLRNFSGVKVMQIISKLRETDAKSKGLDNVSTPSGDLMKELLFFILH